MSQSLSSVIDYLTYTGTLAPSGTWTSTKVQILEFSSLSLSFNSDQNHSIYFLFSDDGTNFDMSVPEEFVPASSYAGGQNYTTPCIGSWVRIQLVNTSSSSSTYTRLYVYGSINNLVSKSIIEGNVNVDVANVNILSPINPQGELITSEYQILPGSSLNFNLYQNVSRTTFSSTDPTPYLANLVKYRTSDDTVSLYAITDGTLILNLFNPPLNEYSCFYSPTYQPYIAGATLVIQFTAYFKFFPYNDGAFSSTNQVGFGVLPSALTNVWDAGVSIGTGIPINDGSGNFTYTPYLTFHNVNGSQTKIWQPDFNVDVLDGTNSVDNPSGMLLDPTVLNTYRFVICNSSSETFIGQVYDRTSHKFITFHIVEYSQIDCPSAIYGGQFIMDCLGNLPGANLNNNNFGVTNYCAYTNYFPIYKNLTTHLCTQQATSVSTSVTSILSIYQPSTFNSKSTTLVTRLDSISIINASPAATTLYIYKNNTYSPSLVYTTIDTIRAPTQRSAPTVVPSAYGNLLKIYYITQSTSQTIPIKDIYINPNEELLFSAQLFSGAPPVVIWLNVNMSQIG